MFLGEDKDLGLVSMVLRLGRSIVMLGTEER